jgi:putative tryptophan/tyrosine transport system substrate-binding protein
LRFEAREKLLVKRREFITLLGGAAVAWPLAARAQQAAMPVIGFLGSGSRESDAIRMNAFRRGLNEAGYVEGRNVAIEYRFADGQHDRLTALAAELVRHHVAVIITGSTPGTLAAKAATTTIPIVFYLAVDPVEVGLVASMNRPGGQLTGVSNLGVMLGPKQLELAHELLPEATNMALLLNPTSPTLAEPQSRDVQAAARTLGLKLHVLHASTDRDLDTIFATLPRLQAGALVIGTDAFFSSRSERLAALTVRHAVPAIHQYRDFVAAGGLMSYGTSLTDAYRQVGIYAAKILQGAKPADLAVQQVVKVELFINLKTARALGLTVPLPLLGRADEVIQ